MKDMNELIESVDIKKDISVGKILFFTGVVGVGVFLLANVVLIFL